MSEDRYHFVTVIPSARMLGMLKIKKFLASLSGSARTKLSKDPHLTIPPRTSLPVVVRPSNQSPREAMSYRMGDLVGGVFIEDIEPTEDNLGYRLSLSVRPNGPMGDILIAMGEHDEPPCRIVPRLLERKDEEGHREVLEFISWDMKNNS